MVTRTRVLTAAMVAGMFLSLARPAFGQVPAATPNVSRGYHIFLAGKARMVVTDSLDGAARRLATPQCQQLFTDFTDLTGRPLSEALAGKAATELLAGLYFVDGDGAPQCRASEALAAFTVPNSRVIYVCGTRFAERFARKTVGGEVLLIHELLHALGLGENPPTSAQITDAVLRRCHP